MNRYRTARTFTPWTVLACMAFVFQSPAAAYPPANKQNLITSLELDEAAVDGEWTRGDAGVRCSDGGPAKLRLCDDPEGEYTLTIEFTRHSGEHGVGIVASYDGTNFAWVVGDAKAVANGFRAASGGAAGDGGGGNDSRGGAAGNGTAGTKLQSGQKHRVFINVGEALLEAKLNGKSLGKISKPDYSSFELDAALAIDGGGIGVVSLGSDITIHSAVIKPKGQPRAADNNRREEPDEREVTRPEKKQPAKPAGVALAAPSHWSGTRSKTNRGGPAANCQIRINRRNGDIYQLTYCEHHCQRKIAMTFKLTARGELILQGWKNQSVADLTIQNVQAQGSTNGQGMQIGYSWVESGRRHQNAIVQGTIDVTLD